MAAAVRIPRDQFACIFISHEKVLKALEQEEKEKEDVIPLLLTIRVARSFSLERLAIGRVYLYVWYVASDALLVLLKSAIG
jgi:hypothetical protein